METSLAVLSEEAAEVVDDEEKVGRGDAAELDRCQGPHRQISPESPTGSDSGARRSCLRRAGRSGSRLSEITVEDENEARIQCCRPWPGFCNQEPHRKTIVNFTDADPEIVEVIVDVDGHTVAEPQARTPHNDGPSSFPIDNCPAKAPEVDGSRTDIACSCAAM
mmetsp:Transcript_45624/g.97475  ORF Transcript_45624/g.97475 Transcript_45624/m.97475 type:complete len:164 (+) Transcript_45624:131-622(+)